MAETGEEVFENQNFYLPISASNSFLPNCNFRKPKMIKKYFLQKNARMTADLMNSILYSFR